MYFKFEVTLSRFRRSKRKCWIWSMSLLLTKLKLCGLTLVGSSLRYQCLWVWYFYLNLDYLGSLLVSGVITLYFLAENKCIIFVEFHSCSCQWVCLPFSFHKLKKNLTLLQLLGRDSAFWMIRPQACASPAWSKGRHCVSYTWSVLQDFFYFLSVWTFVIHVFNFSG